MSATNTQTMTGEKLPFMPEDILKDLYPLLKVQSSSHNEHAMVGYITSRLMGMGLMPVYDHNGNILVTKGKSDAYPCIVAHMDTVHDIRPDFQVKISKKKHNAKAWASAGKSQAGVGGDDKCGIYAVFYCLENIDNIKAVFFTKEEVGMVGSSGIDHGFFNDVGYIIQLDRWGRGDFIDTYHGDSTVSNEYKRLALPVLDQYGYKSTEGLITDSITLWSDGVGVSCVNVSCGYYQHHTDHETIDLNELWNALRMTHSLILTLGENVYPSIYEKPSYKWGETNAFSYYKNSKKKIDEDMFFDVLDYLGIDFFEPGWADKYELLLAVWEEYCSRISAPNSVSYIDMCDYIDNSLEYYNDHEYSYPERYYKDDEWGNKWNDKAYSGMDF